MMMLSKLQPLAVKPSLVTSTVPSRYEHFRLLLLVAPAGFGKSTLAAQLIQKKPDRAVWLSLDERDNDLSQFVLYVVTAIQQIEPTVGHDTLNALRTEDLPSPETLAALLTNSMVAIQEGITLVLDDYHFIHNPAIHEFIVLTIANAIRGFRFIITTRHDPQFPARWRAHGWVHEIRADDLRFSREMAAAYLNGQMNLGLKDDDIDVVVKRTEGWISGLQLAALALSSAVDQSQFVAQFGGSQRFVLDYLMEEVLEHQPSDIQDFLRQTSILERMNANLCRSVTGRNDSADILDELYRQNLFIVVQGSGWFRYHHLLADALRLSLPAAEEAVLHRRAGAWYHAEGLIEEAVSHYLTANDPEIAAACVADYVLTAIGGGDHLHLKHLLSLLPETPQLKHPKLLLARSWFAAHAHQLDSAADLLDKIPVVEADDEICAWIETIRALVAHSCGEADLVLPHIEAAQAHSRAPELTGMYDWLSGVALWEQGRSQQAIDRIHAALRAPSVYNDPFGYSGISSFLSDYLNQIGRRQESLAVCERLMNELVDTDDNLLAHAAPIVGQAGILHYEANDLDTASYLLNTGLRLSQPMNLTQGLVIGRIYLALIDYACGRKEESYRTLHEARHVASSAGSHPFNLVVDAVENWLHLRDGHPEWMTRWLEHLTLDHPRLPFTVRLIALRGLVYTQDKRAASLLETLENTARQTGYVRHLITLLILKSLHRDQQPDHAAAFAALREAVRLAVVGDYRRDFLDEPPRVLEMLARIQDTAPAFIEGLIQRVPKAVKVTPSLMDPLTERELKVIELAALGYSNREIAAEMFVAVSTIKTHIKHAFDKLNADGSRTRAIARARELGLLQDL
jgi:LuxR family maltose regulon positive regulatory protein